MLAEPPNVLPGINPDQSGFAAMRPPAEFGNVEDHF